jgi:hypothetical protein
MTVKNEMSVRSALAILEKKGIVERGRQTEAAALVALAVPVDAALAAVPVPSIESTVLDDLVYGWSIGDRDDTELDVARIASDLALSAAQVRGALTGLANRGIIKYKNAFRGRGVRLLKPEPSELALDRKELSARASRAQSKLRRMIEYCYSKACLRRFVLNYFGDPKRITRCSACSSCHPESIAGLHPAPRKQENYGILTLKNSSSRGAAQTAPHLSAADTHPAGSASCQLAPTPVPSAADNEVNDQAASASHQLTPSPVPGTADNKASDRHKSPGRPLSEPETVIVKKVLSCVARLNDRFGKGTIASVLSGASSAEISTHKLAGIPTFGALRDTGLSQIKLFIKALVTAGCVEVNPGPYPTLRLSEFGRDVMQGRADVFLVFAESQEI